MRCMRFLVPAVIAAIGCGGGEETSCAENAVHVNFLNLVPLDSIGVETGDSCYMFGAISDPVYTPEGTILLLDRGFCRVMEYSGEGEFLRSIGGRGNGPGEMSMAVLMCLTGNGDILVSQRDALERFDRSAWEWVDEYPRGETPPPFVLTGMPDSTYVGVHFEIVPGVDRLCGKVTAGVFRPGSSTPELQLHSSTFTLDPMNGAFLFEDVLDAYSVAVDSGGRIFLAGNSRDLYSFSIFDPEGNLVRTVTRDDIEPSELTAEERSLERRFMEARLQSMGAEGQPCRPESLLPMVSDMGIGQEGNLWVRRGGERYPFFDIYTPDGQLTATASMHIKEGTRWTVSVSPGGILAYQEDPASGYQKLYMMAAE